jgi:1-acyl-sn-glycerol-3-phosphate acyltransferase
MSRSNIKNFSFGYELVYIISALFHRIYYRRFKVINRQKIPKNSPVIFAVNHQNALMDALAVLYAVHGQKVFMARADIFRKKWTARLLYFLKILPAYRIRDGFHSVDQNKETFKEVIKVLEHNTPFCILPEGNHYGEKRLRPLQKGAARLAFLAEEANDFKLGLYIVPVGLDYSNYYNAGSDLLVTFGDPITVAGYQEQYIQNPLLAIGQLRDDLAGAMRKLMIDINPCEHYKTIYSAIEMYGPVELKKQQLRNTLVNSFRVKKQLSTALITSLRKNETASNTLQPEMDAYQKKITENDLKDWLVARQSINPASFIIESFITLLLMPVHLYGMILNYLPYRLPVYMTRKIKDRHFISSIRFVLGMLFFFAWYLIIPIASFFIFDNLFLNLAFILSLPVTGIFSFYYYRHLLKLRGKLRWIRLKIKNRKAYDELLRLRKDIITQIEKILFDSNISE